MSEPAANVAAANCAPTRPKTALIVEGGAMRGAWAAGVLGALHESGHHHFDLVVAASSGACSAAYFVAGMVAPGLEIWKQHVGDQKMLRKTNWLRFKPMIDLAYLIDHLFRNKFPFPLDVFGARTRFEIVLTDCHKGEPVYFHARNEWIYEALKASASLPFATRGYSFVCGVPYADGGIADPIPIRHVLEAGATDITVILTHDKEFRLAPMPRWICRLAYPWFPSVAQAWINRHVEYNKCLALLDSPPTGVRIRVFRPMRPLPVERFTSDSTRLRAAISLGHDEAYLQLNPDRAPDRK